MNNEKETTDFGFTRVPRHEKVKRVGQVFNSVAQRYDLMNDLMSLGIHRLWKKFVCDMANVRVGQHVLDLAGGTGDLAEYFVRQVGLQGAVIVGDINSNMLQVGRDRQLDKGTVLNYVQLNAECLPFADNTFDTITMAFGLRNVTQKEAALASMQRVLKVGGQVLILEFSEFRVAPLKPLYDLYSFQVLPLMGKLVAQDADSYRYLAESIRMHPNQETLLNMMENAGFARCSYHNLSGGIAAVHRGYKF